MLSTHPQVMIFLVKIVVIFSFQAELSHVPDSTSFSHVVGLRLAK